MWYLYAVPAEIYYALEPGGCFYTPLKRTHTDPPATGMKHLSSVSAYYIRVFGSKALRLTVGARGTCPNRGADGSGGCLYCDVLGSASDDLKLDAPLKEQIGNRLVPGAKQILYFQPFTATYGDDEILRGQFEEALGWEGIVGLAVGTRPDCISDRMWEILADLNRGTHLELELGLQSAHDATLCFIHRGHTVRDFKKAAHKAASLGIRVIAHIIAGLPGETTEYLLKTIEFLNAFPIHGLKLHPLHVMASSSMARLYRIERMTEGGEIFPADGYPDLRILTRDGYVEMAVEALSRLNEDIIVYRVTGERRTPDFLGPKWLLKKSEYMNLIRASLKAKGVEWI